MSLITKLHFLFSYIVQHRRLFPHTEFSNLYLQRFCRGFYFYRCVCTQTVREKGECFPRSYQKQIDMSIRDSKPTSENVPTQITKWVSQLGKPGQSNNGSVSYPDNLFHLNSTES